MSVREGGIGKKKEKKRKKKKQQNYLIMGACNSLRQVPQTSTKTVSLRKVWPYPVVKDPSSGPRLENTTSGQ